MPNKRFSPAQIVTLPQLISCLALSRNSSPALITIKAG
jgi:hypothetical protein